MTTHLAFWALALVLLAAITTSTLMGWLEIRRGRVSRHQRWMNLGGALVGVFLVLYLIKVLILGTEDLSTWSPASLTVLYVHETLIALMLVSTSAAHWISRRLRRADPADRLRQLHRLFGRLGAVACLLGFVSAIFIFSGMVERAGL